MYKFVSLTKSELFWISIYPKGYGKAGLVITIGSNHLVITMADKEFFIILFFDLKTRVF